MVHFVLYLHVCVYRFDRNIGGQEIQLRLRDHLAKLFNDQKKTTSDVTQNQRAMAKLYKEAGRLKQVLSANTDHYAQVESLLDDEDFKAKVTRAELEEMCVDIFDRIGAVVEDALKSSEVTMVRVDFYEKLSFVHSALRVTSHFILANLNYVHVAHCSLRYIIFLI